MKKEQNLKPGNGSDDLFGQNSELFPFQPNRSEPVKMGLLPKIVSRLIPFVPLVLKSLFSTFFKKKGEQSAAEPQKESGEETKETECREVVKVETLKNFENVEAPRTVWDKGFSSVVSDREDPPLTQALDRLLK